MGESPQAGWEGDSELGFPLDDVPKESAGKFAARGVQGCLRRQQAAENSPRTLGLACC